MAQHACSAQSVGQGQWRAECSTCGWSGRTRTNDRLAREDAITHKYKTSPAQQQQWAGLHSRGYR